MPASDELTTRVRNLMHDRVDVVERRMFGGVAFMIKGHMACGAVGDKLMVRLGEIGVSRAFAEPHVKPMDFTGKVMKSMVFVEAAGIEDTRQLRKWVQRSIRFVETLPPKA